MTGFKTKLKNALDRLTTNPWTAFPVFILIVYFLFWCTFYLGQYPMDWIQAGVDALSVWLDSVIRVEWLRDLTVDGVLAGVGGVLVFLPNIIILYLMISVMDSSGYLGRAAYLMDRIMHGMGLHGRSFIPMIMGFGCNVPAIMACREIDSPKGRMITTLVIPFLSCSGRLPVYLLFVAAFFPEHGPLLLLGIYGLGLILAVVAAKILSLVIPGISEHDHLQIKAYHRPNWHFVLSNTWEQVREYLKKLAGPILAFSVALWLLGYFPRAAEGASDYEQMEQSCIGMVGRSIEPAIEPMGMNWKDGVAILAGVGAKELIVSTLGVMYSNSGTYSDDNRDTTLDDSSDSSSDSRLVGALKSSHTPAGALAFMVFVLLYFPCIGTFIALRNSLGSWKWTIGAAVNSIVIALLMSWITFNVAGILT